MSNKKEREVEVKPEVVEVKPLKVEPVEAKSDPKSKLPYSVGDVTDCVVYVEFGHVVVDIPDKNLVKIKLPVGKSSFTITASA